MSYLYVNEQGAKISTEGGYITVNQKDGCTRNIPCETLDNIAVFGNVSLSVPAMRRCLEKGITCSFFSTKGKYFGRLTSTSSCRIARQRKQFKLGTDPHFVLELDRNIVKGKIHNQKVLLRRYIKEETFHLANNLKQITNAEKKIESCNTLEEIMGYEGIAARHYFDSISSIIDEDFKFNGRNRMPPKDPFNSMISLGYTLLMHEIYGDIEGHGMNPYAGFLHQDRENHPTLASDLMEEWRAVIVDATVLSLIQGHEITIDEFMCDTDSGGILLMDSGFKTFIKKYENKLRTEVKYTGSGGRYSYRELLNRQAGLLAKAIDEEDPHIYKAINIR